MTDRKKQILLAAQKLIRENGYMAASMRDLAKQLQMEAPSLYNHIESKEEILSDICFDMADRFVTAMQEVNDIYFNADQKLTTAIRNHISILTENLDASHVFLHEWKNLNEPMLGRFKTMRDQYEEGFRVILQTGIDEGIFEENDVKFAALTILSSLNWIVEWYKPDGSMTPNQIAEKLTSFILTGLKIRNINF